MACHHHVPVPATKAYLPSEAGLVWHRMPFIAKIDREWEQAGLCAPERVCETHKRSWIAKT